MSVPTAVGHRWGPTKPGFYNCLSTREELSFVCWLPIKVTAVKTNEKLRQIHQVHISEQRPPSSGSDFLCNCTDNVHFLLTQQTFMEHFLASLALDKNDSKMFPNTVFSFLNNFRNCFPNNWELRQYVRKLGRAPKLSTSPWSHSEVGSLKRCKAGERYGWKRIEVKTMTKTSVCTCMKLSKNKRT